MVGDHAYNAAEDLLDENGNPRMFTDPLVTDGLRPGIFLERSETYTRAQEALEAAADEETTARLLLDSFGDD